jgi:hypothetical protein
MLRRAPLRARKPWRAKHAPAARQAKQVDYIARPRAVAIAAVELPMAEPMRKFEYVRDVRLRDMCRAMPCQHCGAAGTTWAHSNWACHGKGKSIKASDIYVAALCAACHHDLDQGNVMTDFERWCMWRSAFGSTVAEAITRGLWPAGVPMPNMDLAPHFAAQQLPQGATQEETA